jgi:hypothetical protein
MARLLLARLFLVHLVATLAACARATPFDVARRDYLECLRDHSDTHRTDCSTARAIWEVEYRTRALEAVPPADGHAGAGVASPGPGFGARAASP